MARIASLYLPWLGIVIENIGRLDYRKRIINKITKQSLDLSLSRYFIIFNYFLLLYVEIYYINNNFYILDNLTIPTTLLQECH